MVILKRFYNRIKTLLGESDMDLKVVRFGCQSLVVAITTAKHLLNQFNDLYSSLFIINYVQVEQNNLLFETIQVK
jgi:hypothetical protein